MPLFFLVSAYPSAYYIIPSHAYTPSTYHCLTYLDLSMQPFSRAMDILQGLQCCGRHQHRLACQWGVRSSCSSSGSGSSCGGSIARGSWRTPPPFCFYHLFFPVCQPVLCLQKPLGKGVVLVWEQESSTRGLQIHFIWLAQEKLLLFYPSLNLQGWTTARKPLVIHQVSKNLFAAVDQTKLCPEFT
jgi:hypothetical protein